MSTASGVAARQQVSGFSRAGVEELSRIKGEPDWLLARRLHAWDQFEALPWPSGKEEDWRRFDLSGFRLDELVAYHDPGYRAETSGTLPAEVAAALGDDSGSAVIQHDSAGVYRRLADDLAAQGVLFGALDSAVRHHPEIVKEHLGSRVTSEAGKFEALHNAFWSGGAFLYVPANTQISVPLRAVHWLGSTNTALFTHTLVVVEPGAEVTFIDDYVSDTAASGFDCSAVELIVRAGARLRYVNLQDWGPGVVSVNHLGGFSGRDSTTNWLMVAVGGKATRTTLDASLAEQGTSNELLGLFFGDGRQVFDFHTLQDHLAPNATSDLLFKGVLKDFAKSAYAGLIRVAPGAQRTDAYLANRNLLLSDKSRADSIPTLEIEANDVRCTHGATVGPVDEEQLFYLMARGIPRSDAVKVIVEGFLEPLVSRIPLEGVRERIDRSIARKML